MFGRWYEVILLLMGLSIIGVIVYSGTDLFRPDPDTARRESYIEAHPGISSSVKEAIRQGQVLPGMSREQVAASVGTPLQSAQRNGTEALIVPTAEATERTSERAIVLDRGVVAKVYAVPDDERIEDLMKRLLYIHSHDLPPEREQALANRETVVGMTKQEVKLVRPDVEVTMRPESAQVITGDGWALWNLGSVVLHFTQDQLQGIRQPSGSESSQRLMHKWAYLLNHPERPAEVAAGLFAANVVPGMKTAEVSLAWGEPSQAIRVDQTRKLWGYSGKRQVLLFKNVTLTEMRSVEATADLRPLMTRWAYTLEAEGLSSDMKTALLNERVLLEMTREEVTLIHGDPPLMRQIGESGAVIAYPDRNIVMRFEGGRLIERKSPQATTVRDLFARWVYVLEHSDRDAAIREAILGRRLTAGLQAQEVKLIHGEPTAKRILQEDRELWGYRGLNKVLLFNEGTLQLFRNVQSDNTITDIFRQSEHVTTGNGWTLWNFGSTVLHFVQGQLKQKRQPSDNESSQELMRKWAYVLDHAERPSEVTSALFASNVVTGMTPTEVSLAWGEPSQTLQVNETWEIWGYAGKQQVLLFEADRFSETRSLDAADDLRPLMTRWAYTLKADGLSGDVRTALLNKRVLEGMTREQVTLIHDDPPLARQVGEDQAVLAYPSRDVVMRLEGGRLVERKTPQETSTSDLFNRWVYTLEHPDRDEAIRNAILERRLVEGLQQNEVSLVFGEATAKRVIREERELWGYRSLEKVLLFNDGILRQFRNVQADSTVTDVFRRWTYVLTTDVPEEARKIILDGEIEIGLSTREVRASWGEPADTTVQRSEGQTVESWVYTRPEGKYKLIFENDELSNWTAF